MRVPIRKGGQYTNIQSDPIMTKDKFKELEKELNSLKNTQPKLAEEVKRLALMGDFSENAAYQIAKGRLRSVNSKIEKISKQIAEANIIEENKNTNTVSIGHEVSIKSNIDTKKYRILGSLETDPLKGIISYRSPIGKALLNKSLGDTIKIKNNNELIEYKIISIK